MICPYKTQDAEAFWHKQQKETIIDTQVAVKFKLNKKLKIATAGSCFASRIARALKLYDMTFFCAEPAPAFLPTELHEKYHYGLFSARYGNVYSTLQLLQLFERAFSLADYDEPALIDEQKYYDPFRPLVQPGGFDTAAQLRIEQSKHLECVKNMFLNADVFVFTLGLTETWISAESGACLPLCPGCQVGQYDEKYQFTNLSTAQNIINMQMFIEHLRQFNPDCKVILTVSPVPLVATMEQNGAIRATQYSKSVLRVVAEEISQQYEWVDYFSSYEVFNSCRKQTAYFAENNRDIRDVGVEHVMSLFFSHYFDLDIVSLKSREEELKKDVESANTSSSVAEPIPDPACDESTLLAAISENSLKS